VSSTYRQFHVADVPSVSGSGQENIGIVFTRFCQFDDLVVGEMGRGLGAMRVTRSAQFQLSVDGVPRSYRDRKDLALQGAQILKSRNPNSVVKLKDLQTGEEFVIAFKSAQQ
jgi:hypothetical protein